MSSDYIFESELVSNYDALQCINDRLNSRRVSKKLRAKGEVAWVAQRAMEYLQRTSAANQNNDSIVKFLAAVRDEHKLVFTKAETLQLLNLNPDLEVTLFLILEECGDRFNEDERELLLESCKLMIAQQNGAQQNGNQHETANDS